VKYKNSRIMFIMWELTAAQQRIFILAATTLKIAEFICQMKDGGVGKFQLALNPSILRLDPLTAPVYPANPTVEDMKERDQQLK
jgi:hypothetical protein